MRTEELQAPRDGEARVRTLYSAISKGTETLVFEGRVPASEFRRMRAPFQEGDFPSPVKYGYINVGVVEEGANSLLGRSVFCLYPHQSAYVVSCEALTLLPPDFEAKRAVLLAGMETALNAMWDATPRIGDEVRVVGGGVIGCLIAYLAARVVGCRVQLVDTNAARAQVATALGVEVVLPEAAAPEADLVLHASGSEAGLQLAMRLAGFEAKVVEVSWFGNQSVSLSLGEGFHSQRLQLISSQVGHVSPLQRGRWTYARRMNLAIELLRDPALDCLITGESDFADLPATLKEVTSSASALCQRIRYPAIS